MSRLKNDFYTVKTDSSTSDTGFSALIELNEAHPIYSGHFPQMPVVPGVCQVQIIKELLEDKLNSRLLMLTGDNIKFTGMIVPTQNSMISIDFSYSIKDNEVVAEAKLFHETTVFTKFKGTFKIIES